MDTRTPTVLSKYHRRTASDNFLHLPTANDSDPIRSTESARSTSGGSIGSIRALRNKFQSLGGGGKKPNVPTIGPVKPAPKITTSASLGGVGGKTLPSNLTAKSSSDSPDELGRMRSYYSVSSVAGIGAGRRDSLGGNSPSSYRPSLESVRSNNKLSPVREPTPMSTSNSQSSHPNPSSYRNSTAQSISAPASANRFSKDFARSADQPTLSQLRARPSSSPARRPSLLLKSKTPPNIYRSSHQRSDSQPQSFMSFPTPTPTSPPSRHHTGAGFMRAGVNSMMRPIEPVVESPLDTPSQTTDSSPISSIPAVNDIIKQDDFAYRRLSFSLPTPDKRPSFLPPRADGYRDGGHLVGLGVSDRMAQYQRGVNQHNSNTPSPASVISALPPNSPNSISRRAITPKVSSDTMIISRYAEIEYEGEEEDSEEGAFNSQNDSYALPSTIPEEDPKEVELIQTPTKRGPEISDTPSRFTTFSSKSSLERLRSTSTPSPTPRSHPPHLRARTNSNISHNTFGQRDNFVDAPPSPEPSVRASRSTGKLGSSPIKKELERGPSLGPKSRGKAVEEPAFKPRLMRAQRSLSGEGWSKEYLRDAEDDTQARWGGQDVTDTSVTPNLTILTSTSELETGTHDKRKPMIGSPLEKMVQGLTGKIRRTKSSLSVSSQVPEAWTEPPHTQSPPRARSFDSSGSPVELNREGLSMEEMESEITRMEAELSTHGKHFSRSSTIRSLSGDRDSSTINLRGSPNPNSNEVTPKTAKRWSIVEMESAYERIKTMLRSSSKSYAVSESGGTVYDDSEDLAGAFERAIGSSDPPLTPSWQHDSPSVGGNTFSSSNQKSPSPLPIASFEKPLQGADEDGHSSTPSDGDTISSPATSPPTSRKPSLDPGFRRESTTDSLASSTSLPFSPRFPFPPAFEIPPSPTIATLTATQSPLHRHQRAPSHDSSFSNITSSGARSLQLNTHAGAPVVVATKQGSIPYSASATSGEEGWETPMTSPPFAQGGPFSETASTTEMSPRSVAARDKWMAATDSENSSSIEMDTPRDSRGERGMLKDRTVSEITLSNIQRFEASTKEPSASNGTWYPATPDRAPFKKFQSVPSHDLLPNSAELSRLSIQSTASSNSTLNMADIRKMDKLEVYFKYAAMKTDLEKVEMERNACLDALKESRIAFKEVRQQKEALEAQLLDGGQLPINKNLESILGPDPETQANRLDDLVQSRQMWESRAREALDELERAREDAEALQRALLQGLDREEELEQETVNLGTKVASLSAAVRDAKAGSPRSIGGSFKSPTLGSPSIMSRSRLISPLSIVDTFSPTPSNSRSLPALPSPAAKLADEYRQRPLSHSSSSSDPELSIVDYGSPIVREEVSFSPSLEHTKRNGNESKLASNYSEMMLPKSPAKAKFALIGSNSAPKGMTLKKPSFGRKVSSNSTNTVDSVESDGSVVGGLTRSKSLGSWGRKRGSVGEMPQPSTKYT